MVYEMTEYRLSKPIIRFSHHSTALSELVRSSGYNSNDYPWAARMLGKHPIPSWQRELCWSKQKSRKFIHSVFQGFDLGSVMKNGYQYANNSDILMPMSDILIDGQQRINALILFINNEIDYETYYWNDLNRLEQRTFLESQIGLKSTNCFDKEVLKKVYNLLNFSGVRHKHSEIAK